MLNSDIIRAPFLKSFKSVLTHCSKMVMKPRIHLNMFPMENILFWVFICLLLSLWLLTWLNFFFVVLNHIEWKCLGRDAAFGFQMEFYKTKVIIMKALECTHFPTLLYLEKDIFQV